MTIVVSALTVVLIFFYSFTHKIPKKPAARITSVTTIPMDSAFTISDSKGTTVLITPRSNFVGGNNESDYIQYEWKYYRKLMHRLLLVESGQTETRYDRIGFFDPSGRNKLSIEWSSRGIDAIWIYPEPSINVNTNPTSLVEHGAHP